MRADAYWSIAAAQARSGLNESAVANFKRAKQALADVRSPLDRSWIMSNLVVSQIRAKDLPAAEKALAQAVAITRQITSPWARAQGIAKLAESLIVFEATTTPGTAMSENPIKIRTLDHLVLRVADLDRALAFYRDTIGCPIERRIDKIGLVQLRAGTSLIDLVPIDSELGRKLGAGPAEHGRNLDHFALELDGFDADAIQNLSLQARRRCRRRRRPLWRARDGTVALPAGSRRQHGRTQGPSKTRHVAHPLVVSSSKIAAETITKRSHARERR